MTTTPTRSRSASARRGRSPSRSSSTSLLPLLVLAVARLARGRPERDRRVACCWHRRCFLLLAGLAGKFVAGEILSRRPSGEGYRATGTRWSSAASWRRRTSSRSGWRRRCSTPSSSTGGCPAAPLARRRRWRSPPRSSFRARSRLSRASSATCRRTPVVALAAALLVAVVVFPRRRRAGASAHSGCSSAARSWRSG